MSGAGFKGVPATGLVALGVTLLLVRRGEDTFHVTVQSPEGA